MPEGGKCLPVYKAPNDKKGREHTENKEKPPKPGGFSLRAVKKFFVEIWATIKWYVGLFIPKKATQKHKQGNYYTGRINRRLPESMQNSQHYQEGAKPPQHTKEEIRKEKKKRYRKKIFKRVLLGMAAAFLLAILVVSGMVMYNLRNDDLWLNLDQVPYRTETILYYTDQQTGEVLEYARLPSTQNKEYVPAEQIPQMLKDAFVAIEDKDFYDHNGVSLRRTAFAVLNELKHQITGSYIGGDSGQKQGASTINQQLIKNLTQDDQNSNLAGYMRKLREIVRAYRLNSSYDKDTILCAYLNTISFTGNTAGVQAEAKKLFGKSVEELTLAECASLAAITRNPARYNPVTNPENHLQRRNYVLYEMKEQGYITEDAYAAAIEEPLQLTGDTDPPYNQAINSYFTDTVIEAVVTQLQEARGLSRKEANFLLYNGGLRIYTTVVPELQASMEYAMASGEYYPRPAATASKPLTDENGTVLRDEEGNVLYCDVTVYPQAAMISLNYEGGICAVVGGLGEKEVNRGFNRATSGTRQVGSTMKPIGPYAVALEKDKITWSSSFLDAPVEKQKDETTGEMVDWPANATKTYSEKDMLVLEAFIKSTNTVAVRVGKTVGNLAMYNFVHGKLGIPLTLKDIAPGPLVLGSSTNGITPLDMAKSYAIYGNGGVVYDTYCFTHISGGDGTVYLEVKTKSKQAVGDDTAYIMNRLMREVMVGNGSASGMSVRDGMDSIGKTGTTSDYRDHWFVGLTPYYVTASWYGYDENLTLGVNAHWRPPILAWRAAMEQGQKNLPHKEFPTSDAVQTHAYCTQSGYAAGPNCPSATGYYKTGNPPKEGCPLHS